MSAGKANKRSLERKNLIYFPKALLKENNEEFGKIVDITVEGFMLIRYNAVQSGNNFDLRIAWEAEDGHEELFDCSVTACWCKPDKNPELYAIGFKFNNRDAKSDNEVTRLIRKWSFPEW